MFPNQFNWYRNYFSLIAFNDLFYFAKGNKNNENKQKNSFFAQLEQPPFP